MLTGREMRTEEYDKIAWSDFERARHGPKGAGQEPGVISLPRPIDELHKGFV
jgi:hypothetical protein